MEDVLTGLHSEECSRCASFPSHVLKASSKAITSEYDGYPFRMVLMKLHDAADRPKRHNICLGFFATRPSQRDLPEPVDCTEVLPVR